MRVTAIVAVAVAAGIAAAPAPAEWGPPSLLTVSPREQADGVGTSVLSASGRYLAFSGSLDGTAGILRRDLQTGAIEPVAAARAYGGAPILDASNPSISADGRYVSFTTAVALDPADDHNGASDVYVRDMEASIPADGTPCAIGGPCAYALASAADGTAAGLSYADDSGSVAAPRQALSADGHRVAFVVRSASDLTGSGTPAGQVAVRDLDTEQTTLVSSERDPVTGAMTSEPVSGGAVVTGEGGVVDGYAALSADGTTVAWDGTHIDRQAPTIPGDPARMSASYNEPLWRRIVAGPSAPTRRVAGAADPEAPGCPADGTMDDAACRGPYPDLGLNHDDFFFTQGGWLTNPAPTIAQPALSADGRTVAFLGGPPILDLFNRITDVFVADMHDGISGRQAVRRLTDALGNRAFQPEVKDLAISADGQRIAFTASRVEFPLLSPAVNGPMPPQLGGGEELYLVDLSGQTLQWLSRTVDDGPSTGGASSPSFDLSGHLLAFDSSASNLVAVDANNANDAFLVRDSSVPPGTHGRFDISAPPRAARLHRAWRLALRAVAQPDGSVRFDADCPGAGVLRATITATVLVWRSVRVETRSGKRKLERRRVLATERVARGWKKVRGAGLSKLTVRASRAYGSLVRGKAGLEATAKVTFAARGHRKLKETLAIRFRKADR